MKHFYRGLCIGLPLGCAYAFHVGAYAVAILYGLFFFLALRMTIPSGGE